MFVGYEIKAQQNQAKPVILETDIKLSQAVLDPSKGGKKDPVCLMVEYDKKQFIIAVLDSTRSWQCPLDLMFSAGSEVKFFVKGSGTVHLTGFEYRDDMNSELGFDTSSDEEQEEEEEEEEEPKTIEKSKVPEKRASKIDAKSVKTNGVQKAAKKDAKKPSAGDHADSDDEDESDDEDFDSEMMDDDDIDDSDEEDDELDEDLELDDEDEDSEGDEE